MTSRMDSACLIGNSSNSVLVCCRIKGELSCHFNSFVNWNLLKSGKMKVVFSVKNAGGERIQKEVSSSHQHIKFGNIDASVLFTVDGIKVKLVEPFLPENLLQDACEFWIDGIRIGTEFTYDCYVVDLSEQEICRYFGCRHQHDTMRSACFRHTLDLKRRL